jgi:Ca-activated chloride channel family protein
MGLIFWWMLLLWLVVIAGYWLVRYQILGRRKLKNSAVVAVPVAHSDRLTKLPEYIVALKRYRLLLKLAVGTTTLALLGGILLSARPATTSLVIPAEQSRDIMLCLDASGSVLKEDSRLINRFSELVDSFNGQRFGLTLFNSSAVTIIPLNNDYQLTKDQLKKAKTAFQVQKGSVFTALTEGTLADFNAGTSLVGDGLTSCIARLGANPQHRSQSIILGTDNESNGSSIVSIVQAAGLAKQKGIHIYAIDPGIGDASRISDHIQLKNLAEESGGGYYTLNYVDSVNNIITGISRQESKYFAGTPLIAQNDRPSLILLLTSLLTVACLGLIWKLEL